MDDEQQAVNREKAEMKNKGWTFGRLKVETEKGVIQKAAAAHELLHEAEQTELRRAVRRSWVAIGISAAAALFALLTVVLRILEHSATTPTIQPQIQSQPSALATPPPTSSPLPNSSGQSALSAPAVSSPQAAATTQRPASQATPIPSTPKP